jgi:DNA modification methylase
MSLDKLEIMVNKTYNCDCSAGLKQLPERSINCCVTSPPYFGLRDYGVSGQIGLETTPEAYVAKMVAVFQEVKRVLRDDGTLWLNLGDSYSHGGCGARDTERWPKQSRNDHMATQVKKETGVKSKDLIGIPWRVAFALQADGWYLRQDIIWAKPNPMPESVTDRCTKSHEYIFLLSKGPKYYFDNGAIKEPAKYAGDDRGSHKDSRRGTECNAISERCGKTGDWRNRRDVWTVTTKPYKEAHFATFPPDLIRPCILAGCPAGGLVLDPFMGAGTTALVALQEGRQYIGFELNPKYIEIANKRITSVEVKLF